ncbi:fatty acid desaturase family protein [Haliangium sp.]
MSHVAPGASRVTSGDLDEEHEQNLEGDVDVSLAPIQGEDTRRALPKDFFVRKPAVFLTKFTFAMGLVGAGWFVIATHTGGWLGTIASVILVGLIYAHLVELQHECLHGHAFKSKALNRVFGFACGIFLLSSHTHYKHDHLRHHANLGTPRNREFFNYRFSNLHTLSGFLYASFHLGRYLDVGRDILRGFVGKPPAHISNPRDAAKIRTEYQLYGLAVAGAIAYTAVSGDLTVVIAWALATLLVGEPAHFWIELPEHYGLNTQTEGNVLANTRTIHASFLGKWYTNGNNLHTAHHYHQGVPMVQIPRLHEREQRKWHIVERSYWSFFKKVVTGELKNHEQNCMTR